MTERAKGEAGVGRELAVRVEVHPTLRSATGVAVRVAPVYIMGLRASHSRAAREVGENHLARK